MQCPNCKIDVIDTQVSMRFHALHGGKDWPVDVGVCPKCGLLKHAKIAMPVQFKEWIDSHKQDSKAASGA